MTTILASLLFLGITNWFPLPFNYTDRPQVVRALDNQTVFVTAERGSHGLFKTTNDGVTWTYPVLPQINQAAFGLCLATRDTFYAGGDLACIWRSVDGGTTWTLVNGRIQGLPLVYHISFPRGGTVGYTACYTYVYKTTNAGATWTTSIPRPSTGWQGVAFWNDQLGYVCGGGNFIYGTTNGGATWTYKASITGATGLYEIIFPRDSLTSWVVGDMDSGYVWKTTDGWNTYVAQYVGIGPWGQTFYSISFPPGNVTTGYVVGVMPIYTPPIGVIYKTTNGGTSWDLQFSPDSVTFKSVHFPVNDLTGYAVGTRPSGSIRGVVYKTTNGGSSWVEQEPGREPVERRSTLSVSPNPARKNQEITLRGAGATCELYDVSGRLIRRIKGPRFNPNSLDAGVYVLRSGREKVRLTIIK
jgi:photosystem II stability/assembly factor-like uncharacterized protein